MKREKVLIALILLLAFGLRVWGLDDRNIWWDEGLVAWAARLPVADILSWTAHDVHPPLYFLAQRLWWFVVGDGEFVMRYTSLLVGTLNVALIYVLGKAMGGTVAGLLAALFLAVSAFAVSWSQEMRMYIWSAALATLAIWAALRYWQREQWRYWIAYVAAVTAGLWTLYLSVSVLVIANLAFLVVWAGRRLSGRLLWRWIAAQALALLLYLPWLVYALSRIPTWSTAEEFTTGFFAQLYATTLAVGVSTDLERYAVATLLVMAVLLIGVILAWRRAESTEQRAGLLMLLLGLLLPALLVFIVSLPIHIYYAPRLAPRYLIPLAACYYTLLALGIAALARKRRGLAAAVTGLVVVVALLGLIDLYPGRLRRDDLTSLAATLEARVLPGDAVALYSDRDWPLFAAQYAGDWTGVPNGAQMDEANPDWLLEPIWNSSEGLWLVTTPDAVRMDPQGYVRDWLEQRANATRAWDYGDNTLAFYARSEDRSARLDQLAPGHVLPYGTRPTAAAGNASSVWLPLRRFIPGDIVRLALYSPVSSDDFVRIALDGAPSVQVDVPPAPMGDGLRRQEVDLPLLPDLPAGRYDVTVQSGGGAPVAVDSIQVLPRQSIAAQPPDAISTPLDVRLGNSIRLLGYDLPHDQIKPGEAVELTLYWQTSEPLTARYKVFSHLQGEVFNAATGNFLWGQADNEPVSGAAPTNTWLPGVTVADSYSVSLAEDAPDGSYRLIVGLYGLVNGERLPVSDGDGQPPGDSVTLTEIQVDR